MILGIDASQANREKRTGTEWYAFHIIKEFGGLLEKRDVTVRLYTRGKLREDLARELPKNFEVKRLGWFLPRLWVQGRLSLEMLISPPDVLFCPAHTIPLIHPKNTYTTLADIGFKDNPELYDKLSLWYHRFSAWWAVKMAAHIFTPSEFSKKRIMDVYNCSADRLTVTPLAIDGTKFRKVEEDEVKRVLKKYDLVQGGYIFYLGRIEPKKNILGMIRAFESANPDLNLVFAGSRIDTRSIDKYLEERKDLNTKIKFIDYIDEEEKPALYLGAALFLFPTFYEGFGIPILEAQAAGTPVITSKTTSNSEVAGQGAELVNPEDVQEISQAIVGLLSHKDRADHLVEKGYRNLEKYSWQKTASKTLDVMMKE